MTKKHVPAPGRAAGLRGTALCGRGATYATGDHELIRRLALEAILAGQSEHWCADCLRRL